MSNKPQTVKTRKFKIPEPIYEVVAYYAGREHRRYIKAGQTATPLFNTKTQQVIWKITEEIT